MNTTRSLRRPLDERVIGGVCAGLGRYFGVDPLLLRIAWVVFVIVGGSGVLAYLIAWFIIPDEAGQRDTVPLVVLAAVVLLPLLFCMLGFMPFGVRW